MAHPDPLNALLDALEAKLPALLATCPTEGEFWAAFVGEADRIEDQAGDRAEGVNRRINAMLARHGRYIAAVEIDDA